MAETKMPADTYPVEFYREKRWDVRERPDGGHKIIAHFELAVPQRFQDQEGPVVNLALAVHHHVEGSLDPAELREQLLKEAYKALSFLVERGQERFLLDYENSPRARV